MTHSYFYHCRNLAIYHPFHGRQQTEAGKYSAYRKYVSVSILENFIDK
jgi:hypothetical protein